MFLTGGLPGELVSTVVQLLSGVLYTAVGIVFLAFQQILDPPLGGLVKRRYPFQRQKCHCLVIHKTKVFLLQLEVVQRLVTARKDNEEHVVIPLLLELGEGERDVAY